MLVYYYVIIIHNILKWKRGTIIQEKCLKEIYKTMYDILILLLLLLLLEYIVLYYTYIDLINYIIFIHFLLFFLRTPTLIEFLNRSNLLQRPRLLPVTGKNWTRTIYLPSSIRIPFIGRHHQSSLLEHRRRARALSFFHSHTGQPTPGILRVIIIRVYPPFVRPLEYYGRLATGNNNNDSAVVDVV